MHPSVRIIGANWDLGANLRGAAMGPDYVRRTHLMERLQDRGVVVCDQGNIFSYPMSQQYTSKVAVAENQFLLLSREVTNSLVEDQIPVVIGGDHSVAIATISAVSLFYKERKKKFGIVWFDAHADMNTPYTSLTGNIHGMPVSTLLGNGYPELVDFLEKGSKITPDEIVLVGIRDVDPKEQVVLDESGVLYYTMDDVQRLGLKSITEDIIKKFSHMDRLHFSFDLDGLDPLDAPGVSTPVHHGLRAGPTLEALKRLASAIPIGSMEFVELNPLNDIENRTAQLLSDFVIALLS